MTRPQRTYGFDPATKFGWAVFDGRQLIASGAWQTAKPRAHPGMRYRVARLELARLFVRFPPQPGDIIAFEASSTNQRGKAPVRVHCGMLAAIYETAYAVGIPKTHIREVAVPTLKVHATGSGATHGPNKVMKSDMVKYCRAQFHIEPASDDEADAIWVADHCREVPCKRYTCIQQAKARAPSTPKSKTGGRKQSTKKGTRKRSSTRARSKV